MTKDFIVTKEHRRFAEFATAVRKEQTIGICHGDAGVGKTQSARRYAHWDTLGPFIAEWGPRTEDDATHYAAANRSRTVFYTPEVLPRHKDLMREIEHLRMRLGICVDEHQRNIGKVTGSRAVDMTRWIELLIIDEAERLTPTALELLRDQHDRHQLAIILIACRASTSDSGTTHSSTADSDSRTATGHSAGKNCCSSWTGTGNASAASSTPTTSPTRKPSPRSNASPAATSGSSNDSSPRSPEC